MHEIGLLILRITDIFIANEGLERDFEKRPRKTSLLRNLPSSFSFRAGNTQPYRWLEISANGKREAFRRRIRRYECLREKEGIETPGASFNSQPTVLVCASCSTSGTRREGNLLGRDPKRVLRVSRDRERKRGGERKRVCAPLVAY